MSSKLLQPYNKKRSKQVEKGSHKKSKLNNQPLMNEQFHASNLSKIPEISEISLEKLPVQILESIFQYVQTPDLLKLCYLSRDLHSPAQARIYHTLCIGFNNKFDSLLKVNEGTAIGEKHLRLLYESIMINKRLRRLLKVINCTSYQVFDLTKLLLYKTKHLQEFYSDDTQNVPGKNGRGLKKVRSLQYTVPKLTSNLVELEIVHEDSQRFRRFYGKIALDMIKSGSYVNLKKLNFTFPRSPNYIAYPLDHTELSEHKPHFLDFFDEFSAAGVELQLSELGISGNLNNLAEEANQLIYKAVDLGMLKKLHLEHFEFSNTFSEGPTFFESITKHTSSLKSLNVFNSTSNYSRYENSLCETLINNIPHQLEDLYISDLPTSQAATRVIVQDTISSFQRNVVRLKIDSKFEEHAKLFDRFCTSGHFISEDWSVEFKKQLFFPRILRNLHIRPHVCKGHIKAFTETKAKIQEFFENDLIYKRAKEHLPYLTQYYCELVFVNPQLRAVYLNDDMMDLGSK